MLRSLLLSLRLEGPGATAKLLWRRLFSDDERCVFVRYLKPPASPLEFPAETNGVVVRYLTGRDLEDARVRRHQPRVLRHPYDAVVAERAGAIVGAVWFTDTVTPAQPWYGAVEPHLKPPARFNENMFVVPGDKAAAWAIGKTASDRLATAGIRTVVGVIGAQNKPSILMSRMLGARMVARLHVRRRFGRATTVVEALATDRDSGLTNSAKG